MPCDFGLQVNFSERINNLKVDFASYIIYIALKLSFECTDTLNLNVKNVGYISIVMFKLKDIKLIDLTKDSLNPMTILI